MNCKEIAHRIRQLVIRLRCADSIGSIDFADGEPLEGDGSVKELAASNYELVCEEVDEIISALQKSGLAIRPAGGDALAAMLAASEELAAPVFLRMARDSDSFVESARDDLRAALRVSESALCLAAAKLCIDADEIPQRTDDPLVTAADIAWMVYRELRTIDEYRKEWPEPDIPPAGRKAAMWQLSRILPKLREQFPGVKMRPPGTGVAKRKRKQPPA